MKFFGAYLLVLGAVVCVQAQRRALPRDEIPNENVPQVSRGRGRSRFVQNSEYSKSSESIPSSQLATSRLTSRRRPEPQIQERKLPAISNRAYEVEEPIEDTLKKSRVLTESHFEAQNIPSRTLTESPNADVFNDELKFDEIGTTLRPFAEDIISEVPAPKEKKENIPPRVRTVVRKPIRNQIKEERQTKATQRTNQANPASLNEVPKITDNKNVLGNLPAITKSLDESELRKAIVRNSVPHLPLPPVGVPAKINEPAQRRTSRNRVNTNPRNEDVPTIPPRGSTRTRPTRTSRKPIQDQPNSSTQRVRTGRRRQESTTSIPVSRRGPSVFSDEQNLPRSRTVINKRKSEEPVRVNIDLTKPAKKSSKYNSDSFKKDDRKLNSRGRGRRTDKVTTSERTRRKSLSNEIPDARFKERKITPVIDEQKLEVLPLFESEAKIVSDNKGADQLEPLIASATENHQRVLLAPSNYKTSTSVTSKENLKRKPFKDVKESIVVSEITEVTSRKTFTRKAANKPLSSEEIGESDNYPEEFKALLNAKKQGKDSRPLKYNKPLISRNEKITNASEVKISRSSSSTTESSYKQDAENEILPKVSPSTNRPTRKRFSPSPKSAPSRKIPTRFPLTTPDSIPASSEKSVHRFVPKKTVKTEEQVTNRGRHTYNSRKIERNSSNRTKNSLDGVTNYSSQNSINSSPKSRYSSKYRTNNSARAVTRSTTTSPVYTPTIPSFRASNPVIPEVDSDLGLEILNLAIPTRSLSSDSLIDENSGNSSKNEGVNPNFLVLSEAKNPKSEKPVSIIERIINSITAISTEIPATSKAILTTSEAPSETSAILKLTPKRGASPDINEIANSEELVKTLKLDTSKEGVTAKPTTVIQKILDSLSAIQAETTTSIPAAYSTSTVFTSTFEPTVTTTAPTTELNAFKQVGTNFEGVSLGTTTLESSTSPSITTFSSLDAQSTTINPLTVLDFISDDEILQKKTIGTLLDYLNSLTTPDSETSDSAKVIYVTPKASNIVYTSPFYLSTPKVTVTPVTPPLTTSKLFTSPIFTTVASFFKPTSTKVSVNKTPSTNSNNLLNQSNKMSTTTETPKDTTTTMPMPTSSTTMGEKKSTTMASNLLSIFERFVSSTSPNFVLTTLKPTTDMALTTKAMPSTVAKMSTLPPPTTSNKSTDSPLLIPLTTPASTNSTKKNNKISSKINSIPTTTPNNLLGILQKFFPSTIPSLSNKNTKSSTDKPTTKATTMPVQNIFDYFSTIPSVSSFKVSPESVSVFSANDLFSSTIDPDYLSTVTISGKSSYPEFTTISPKPTVKMDMSTVAPVTMKTSGLNSSTTMGVMMNNTSKVTTARTGKLLNVVNDQVSNSIESTPTGPDYFIFAILPNNTILRKKPTPAPKDSSFYIVGLYPNNTIVKKFPNGTLVPMEPVIRVETITSVSETVNTTPKAPLENKSMASSQNVKVPSQPNSTPSTPNKKASSSTTPLLSTTLRSILELLNGRTVEAFNNLVNNSSNNQPTAESSNQIEQNTIYNERNSKSLKPVTTTVQPSTTIMSTLPNVPTALPLTTSKPVQRVTPNIKRVEVRSSTIKPKEKLTTTTSPSFFSTFISTIGTLATTALPFTKRPTTLPPIKYSSTYRAFETTTSRPKTRKTTTLPPQVPASTTLLPRTTTGFLSSLLNNQAVNNGEISKSTVVPLVIAQDFPLLSLFSSTERIRRLTTTLSPKREGRSSTTAPTTTKDLLSSSSNTEKNSITNTESAVKSARRTTTPRDDDITTTLPTKRPLTAQQKKDLDQILALEREQKAILRQLSLLTNLNLNADTFKGIGTNPDDLAKRIASVAKQKEKRKPKSSTKKSTTTTTEATKTSTESATTTTKKPTTKRVKTTTRTPKIKTTVFTTTDPINLAEDVATSQPKTKRKQEDSGRDQQISSLIKLLKESGVTPKPESTYGQNDNAILASLLKERGIGPSTPKSLAKQIQETGLFNNEVTTRPSLLTPPRPGVLRQGLGWILNYLAPPPTTKAPKKSKPKATKKPKPKPKQEDELLTNEPTRITPVISSPSPRDEVSQQELRSLIKQLETIQKNPSAARDLDLSALKGLESIKNVQVVHSGTHGVSPRATGKPVTRAITRNNDQDNIIPVIYSRGKAVKSSTYSPVTVSNSVYDEDEEVTAKIRGRVTLPPVKLRPVSGVDEESESKIRGRLLSAAVNVTRAISGFLGSAFQGASNALQTMIGSGSKMVADYAQSSAVQLTGVQE